jgi:predicted  nucleic acid-binding Zn-ribbon protein
MQIIWFYKLGSKTLYRGGVAIKYQPLLTEDEARYRGEVAIKYLPLLTEDEIRYICSIIPQSDTIDYFNRYPNDFRKISGGFRANTIARHDVGNFLFKHHNQDFVSSFIERHISNWVSPIKEHVNECIEAGDNEDLAYIHTLPYCPFADNIALYFKLIEKESTENYVSLLSSAITAINEVSEKQEKSNKLLDGKEAEIQQIQEQLERSKTDLDRARTELNERLTEINALKRTNHDLEKLRKILETHEETIASLKSNIQKREETLKQLRKELSDVKDSRHQLEIQSNAELHEREETLKQLRKELSDVKDSRHQLEDQIRAEL